MNTHSSSKIKFKAKFNVLKTKSSPVQQKGRLGMNVLVNTSHPSYEQNSRTQLGNFKNNM